MNDTVEIEVLPNGTVRSIYKDEKTENLAAVIGADLKTVKRASNVEWEDAAGGWTVRAAHDPELAIRRGFSMYDGFVVAREGEIVAFTSRKDALSWEETLFWKLLPPLEM